MENALRVLFAQLGEGKVNFPAIVLDQRAKKCLTSCTRQGNILSMGMLTFLHTRPMMKKYRVCSQLAADAACSIFSQWCKIFVDKPTSVGYTDFNDSRKWFLIRSKDSGLERLLIQKALGRGRFLKKGV